MKLSRYLLPLLAALTPSTASAHAFGQRYDLPIPLWLYLWGAGATVVLSFVAIGFFLSGEPTTYRREWEITRTTVITFLHRQRWLSSFIRLLPVLLFSLALATAIFGTHDPGANFAPTFFWIVFWVGLPLFSAFLGNFWEELNPWRTVFRWVVDKDYRPPYHYPARFGYWPAFVVFLFFTWMELVPGNAYFPGVLATLLTGYSLSLFAGAFLFGEEWIRRAEFFSVISHLLGSLAPIKYEKGRVFLRFPGAGLLSLDPTVPGLIPIHVFFISGVSYDGLKESKAWTTLVAAIQSSVALPPYVLGTLGLLGLFLLLLPLYLLFTALVRLLVKTKETTITLAKHFLISLLPIGLVYTVAHYYTLLLIDGQGIIPLLSDPFGMGWDLFGTSDYRINIGIVGAKFIWYSQVVLVVLGHILAVYLAHLIALRLFPQPKLALRSQYPMLVLMVGLTMFALWILSAQLVG